MTSWRPNTSGSLIATAAERASATGTTPTPTTLGSSTEPSVGVAWTAALHRQRRSLHDLPVLHQDRSVWLDNEDVEGLRSVDAMTTERRRPIWWRVSEWEFREAVRRTRDAQRLPRGRTDAKRRIAADYGVCVRTLERWVAYDVRSVKVGKHVALFVLGRGAPSQVTPWERAA